MHGTPAHARQSGSFELRRRFVASGLKKLYTTYQVIQAVTFSHPRSLEVTDFTIPKGSHLRNHPGKGHHRRIARYTQVLDIICTSRTDSSSSSPRTFTEKTSSTEWWRNASWSAWRRSSGARRVLRDPTFFVRMAEGSNRNPGVTRVG